MQNLIGKIVLAVGTTAERLSVILESGQPCWDQTTKKLYLGDGTTYGGLMINYDDTSLRALIDAVEELISDEATARTTADTTLQTNINNEATARANADTTLNGRVDGIESDLSDEVTARTTADTTLQTNITNEAATRLSEDNDLSDRIDDEQDLRIAADTTLQTNITNEASARATAVSNEATARANADTTLNGRVDGVITDLSTEASTRSTADTTLQTNITNEANTRATADTTLQTNITNEATARANADIALDGRLDTVESVLPGKAATADLAGVAFSGDYTDLINTPSIPAGQVPSDWDATSGVSLILNKPVTLSGFGITDAINVSEKGVSVATLVDGKIPLTQIPATAINDVFTVASQAAQLALTAQVGDVARRTDESKTYIHNGGTAGTMADWSLVLSPEAAVTTVNGQVGDVVLDKGDVGLGNVDNTSDANKPVSSATQTALDGKQNNFTSQTANTVFAAPNGSSGTPSFRALVSGDIPSLNYVAPTVTITAGTGLTGGGDLSANRTVALSAGSIASLVKADSALQAANIGSSVQAYDAGLQSIAGLTTLADRSIYTTASDTYATYTLTAAGRALSAIAGTANTTPYLSATNVVSLQATSASGRALWNIGGTTGNMAYLSGSNVWSLTAITADGRGLIGAANYAAMRTNLGLVIGTNVQAYSSTLTDWSGISTSTKVSTGAITSSGLTQATNKILGRTTTGTGAIEEIAVGTGLSLTAGTLTATGTLAAGSNGQIQYNASGAFAGAADTSIEDGQLRLSIPAGAVTAPASGGLKLFAQSSGGRTMPTVKTVNCEYNLQTFIGHKATAFIKTSLGSTSLQQIGIVLSTSGIPTAATWASTNAYTKMRRIEYGAFSVSTSASVGWRVTTAQWTVGCSASDGVGGFHFINTWAPYTGTSVATNRAFSGLTNSTAAPSDVEPSSFSDMIGMGWDSADTNIQLMYRGAGSINKIDLGASFPRPTVDGTDVYRIELFSPASLTQSVSYQVRNITTGAITSGTITSNLPAATTALTIRGYMSVGGTSSTIGIALMDLYVETEY